MKDEGKLAGQIVPHCDRIATESQAAIQQLQDEAQAVEAQAGPAAIEFVKTGAARGQGQGREHRGPRRGPARRGHRAAPAR